MTRPPHLPSVWTRTSTRHVLYADTSHHVTFFYLQPSQERSIRVLDALFTLGYSGLLWVTQSNTSILLQYFLPMPYMDSYTISNRFIRTEPVWIGLNRINLINYLAGNAWGGWCGAWKHELFSMILAIIKQKACFQPRIQSSPKFRPTLRIWVGHVSGLVT